MSCELHDLAPAYALDALDAEEQATFERHLADCPVCTSEVAAAREALAATLAAGEEAPPTRTREEVLARAARTPQVPVGDPAGLRSGEQNSGGDPSPGDAVTPIDVRSDGAGDLVTRRARARRWLATAASFVVVAATGLGSIAVLADRVGEPTVAELAASAEMLTLDGASYEQGALVRTDDADLLVAYRLPPLGDGEEYRAWVVRDDEPRAAGSFRPDEEGSALVVLSEPLTSGDAVLVTPEPEESAADGPTEPAVMSGSVP